MWRWQKNPKEKGTRKKNKWMTNISSWTNEKEATVKDNEYSKINKVIRNKYSTKTNGLIKGLQW